MEFQAENFQKENSPADLSFIDKSKWEMGQFEI